MLGGEITVSVEVFGLKTVNVQLPSTAQEKLQKILQKSVALGNGSTNSSIPLDMLNLKYFRNLNRYV
jgi:hypothetical protein